MSTVVNIGTDYEGDDQDKFTSLVNRISHMWKKEDYGNLISLKRYFEEEIQEIIPSKEFEKRAQKYIKDERLQDVYALHKISEKDILEEEYLQDRLKSFYRKGKIRDGVFLEEKLDVSLPEAQIESIVNDYLEKNSFETIEKMKYLRGDLSIDGEKVQKVYRDNLLPESFTVKRWNQGFKNSRKVEDATEIEPEEKTVRKTFEYLAENFQPYLIEKLEGWTGVEPDTDSLRKKMLENTEDEIDVSGQKVVDMEKYR